MCAGVDDDDDDDDAIAKLCAGSRGTTVRLAARNERIQQADDCKVVNGTRYYR